jgi:ribonucleoside-diphosphate reductase alpha chain
MSDGGTYSSRDHSALAWPDLARQIWDMKYRFKAADGTPIDQTIDDTWARVANAAAQAELPEVRAKWTTEFLDAMRGFAFLPAGRILAGAGTRRNVTLFNCFVMGRIEDDLSSIFGSVREAALTMQQGGGIGHDFSTLRPSGAVVKSIGADASGPVSFMDVWDAMCRTIMSAGSRRGAMMATLRCDHPDIEVFIDAKRDPARLRNFNLSVLVTDAFVTAVRQGDAWPLVFEGKTYKTIDARALWGRIMRATYDYAEPGVIFIDRINAQNNLAYCEQIYATNPCGEQPLPAYGACLLGSINLAQLVIDPFSDTARLDHARLASLTATAVRFLDNIIDVSEYPLEAQRQEAKAKRRIGLGVTGLADALIMLGVRYGSEEAQRCVDRWIGDLKTAAYRASAALALERGAFPLCDVDKLLAAPGLRDLPDDVAASIRRHGLRNGLLTSIAPTGTISLLAGNVSSGIEPVFDFAYKRRVLLPNGTRAEHLVQDYAYALFRARAGADAPLPPAFVVAGELSSAAHLAMQAAAQRHIDSSISKTINCPEDISFEAFKSIYLDAYDLGLKGCTTYRPNATTGSVLVAAMPEPPTSPVTQPMAMPGEPHAKHGLDAVAHVARPPGSARDTADVVYLSEPLERAIALQGVTYKLKWPGSEHAIYVTINDTERNGRRRPFEIFINSKNLEHYAWTLALTRMISAIFRRGGDVSFVVEELKAVFDPQGGRWMDGAYVPSLLAAIGGVIEQHLHAIGFQGDDASKGRLRDESAAVGASARGIVAGEPLHSRSTMGITPHPPHAGRFCPQCASATLLQREGCWVCDSCGFSKCG